MIVEDYCKNFIVIKIKKCLEFFLDFILIFCDVLV